jgi:hypothetical protein
LMRPQICAVTTCLLNVISTSARVQMSDAEASPNGNSVPRAGNAQFS